MFVREPALAFAGGEPELAADPRARRREEGYVADLVSRLRRAAHAPPRYEIKDGTVPEALAACVGESGAELLVMSTHGAGRLEPLKRDSNAEQLLGELSIPVLLLPPPPDGQGSGDARPLRSVLAPIDPAEDASRVIEPLARFACVTQAHVTLVAVLPLGAQGTEAPPESARRAAIRRLDLLADRLRCLGIRAAARVVAGRDVAGAVVDQLNASNLDFVALAPRQAPGTADSITRRIIRQSAKPVLVLPPADAIS